MSEKSKGEYQAEVRQLNAKRRRLKGIDAAPGETKRLTVTEVARTLLDRQHRTASGEVKLTWNAKGDTQIEVNVPTSEKRTIESAAEHAAAVYDTLRARYPRGDGAGRTFTGSDGA